LTGIAFNYIIRADPLAPGCNPYPKDAQSPQPESKVAHDSIADHVSRLAQIRSAVEALPPLAPTFKRRRLAPAPDAFEGVTQLPSIPNVPIGMQALAHMNLQSGHSAVPLGTQAVANLQARANALAPLAHPPLVQKRRPVSPFDYYLFLMTALD